MKQFWILLLLALTATAASADSKQVPSALRTQIATKFSDMKVKDIRPTPINGLFEVSFEKGETAYISADGRFLINGDMYDIDSRTNLTESGRADGRKKLLSKVSDADTITFGPEAAKHTITVFTDVECGYCRKLHSEIEQINKLGIRVRYVAYPRAGPGTDDWQKMEGVWCSKDRKTAITQAKQGGQINTNNCGATPVAKQFELGEQMGVRGTPAIFTKGGDYIGGYLPPEELLKQLDQLTAAAKK